MTLIVIGLSSSMMKGVFVLASKLSKSAPIIRGLRRSTRRSVLSQCTSTRGLKRGGSYALSASDDELVGAGGTVVQTTSHEKPASTLACIVVALLCFALIRSTSCARPARKLAVLYG